ncbi:uncharacterized protein LOC117575659 isoform X1 [Drosophila albomicans]|uniref:Uncharacterized protein LOC117575659 isoform X1 n=1 Tax=Drosophila albomicans TaxID=7291 RepID=A0A9C6T376_DROAB|nr:uncharacterized protein LOC117575659 isoform X1 [Drosophila albomicans]
MALRGICLRLPQHRLFKSVSKVQSFKKHSAFRYVSGSSAAEPMVPFLDTPSCVFSVEALNHHWGAWPVVLISMFGAACELLAIMRLAVMRDDVWYTKGPAPCEIIETRKGYPAPSRKMLVVNQKYETPKGVLDATCGDIEGSPSEEKPIKSEVSTKAVAAHAIASLGVMYMAFIM